MSQSKQVKFILNEWIPALESRDLDAVSKLIDKDFTLTTYPKSINEKEVTGQQWLEQYASIFPLTTSSKTIVHSITESPGKVVLHATLKLTTAGIESSRESIFIEHIGTDADGNLKVKKAEEFTDSKAHLDLTAAFSAAIAKK